MSSVNLGKYSIEQNFEKKPWWQPDIVRYSVYKTQKNGGRKVVQEEQFQVGLFRNLFGTRVTVGSEVVRLDAKRLFQFVNHTRKKQYSSDSVGQLFKQDQKDQGNLNASEIPSVADLVQYVAEHDRRDGKASFQPQVGTLSSGGMIKIDQRGGKKVVFGSGAGKKTMKVNTQNLAELFYCLMTIPKSYPVEKLDRELADLRKRPAADKDVGDNVQIALIKSQIDGMPNHGKRPNIKSIYKYIAGFYPGKLPKVKEIFN